MANNMRTIEREIAGAFIFSADDKLLLGKNVTGGVYADSWVIPGGGIEAEETKLQALKRETMEETGIDISNAEVHEIEGGAKTGQSEKTLRDTGERVLVLMNFHNFVVRLPQPADEVKIITTDDFEQAQWFSRNELPDLQLSDPTIKSLKQLSYL